MLKSLPNNRRLLINWWRLEYSWYELIEQEIGSSGDLNEIEIEIEVPYYLAFGIPNPFLILKKGVSHIWDGWNLIWDRQKKQRSPHSKYDHRIPSNCEFVLLSPRSSTYRDQIEGKRFPKRRDLNWSFYIIRYLMTRIVVAGVAIPQPHNTSICGIVILDI